MDSNEIKKMEFFALNNNQDIQDFGKEFSKYFKLSTMKYDYENDYEWLEVEKDGVVYNISKKLRDFKEEEITNFPSECNYTVGLIFKKNNLSVGDDYTESFGERLASFNGNNIYHYRSWEGVGKNIFKNVVISPLSC